MLLNLCVYIVNLFQSFFQLKKEDSLVLPPNYGNENLHHSGSEYSTFLHGQSSNTNGDNRLLFAQDGSDIHQEPEMDEEWKQRETNTGSVVSPVEKVRSADSVESDRELEVSLLLMLSCKCCVENVDSSSMYAYSG